MKAEIQPIRQSRPLPLQRRASAGAKQLRLRQNRAKGLNNGNLYNDYCMDFNYKERRL